MVEMFRFLTGILEKEEQRLWKVLAAVDFISPLTDIFSFSVMNYIINIAMDEPQRTKEMVIFTLFMGMLSVLKGLFDLYKCRIHNRFIFNGCQKLSEKMCELILKEDLLHHNQKNSIQVLAFVRDDVKNCMNIIETSIDIWISCFTLAGYFVVMVYTSKWLGIVSCMVFTMFIFGMFCYYRDQIRAYGEKSRKYAIKANAQITIAYGNFKEMKIADTSLMVLQKYCHAEKKYMQVQKQFHYKKNLIGTIVQDSIMTTIFIVLAFFLGSPKENMYFVLAQMIVYLTMIVKMIPIAYNIVIGWNDVKFSQKSYEVLKEGMTRYSEIKKAEKEAEKVRKKELTFRKGIYVRQLTFSYNVRKDIFRDASITIPSGSSVAIMGVSGAGKTTFLDLIVGLLTPQAGSILYDDYDIAAGRDGEGICRANIGDIVSYIPQTIYLNGESIFNNVVFFAREDEIDQSRATECLKCAQVWEDIEDMPDGIHTLIGENGTEISGGQRQRIALARALYKEFDLLVMDEATAALDMETEKAVIDSIRQMRGDKTLLIATHHMSLANECDVVYKIENMGFVKVK